MSATIWLTGLPASGKSTLAQLLATRLRAQGHAVVVLDGDVVRAGLSRDLGFSAADRSEQSRRVAHVARLLNSSGVIAIAALISPLASVRAHARHIHGALPFLEVWVRCPLAVCEQRDPKGMYAKARRGEIADFTGVSGPYEEPAAADVIALTDEFDVDACAELVMAKLSHR